MDVDVDNMKRSVLAAPLSVFLHDAVDVRACLLLSRFAAYTSDCIGECSRNSRSINISMLGDACTVTMPPHSATHAMHTCAPASAMVLLRESQHNRAQVSAATLPLIFQSPAASWHSSTRSHGLCLQSSYRHGGAPGAAGGALGWASHAGCATCARAALGRSRCRSCSCSASVVRGALRVARA